MKKREQSIKTAKEKILAMKAGTELDELVERQVFDWKPKFKNGDVQEFYRDDFSPYSTDISAAWQVLKALGKNGRITFELETKPDEVAQFIEIYFTIDTAPEAICKAALLAKYSQ